MNKFKLLGLCTSARGKDSNTYYLLKQAFDRVKADDFEKKIIIASELKLRPCEHHYSINAKMCVHPCLITQTDLQDEMKKIYDAIIESDAVIFSTPIYWGNQSQLMQLIIERLNSLENENSVHGRIVVKNKIGGLMILGHEDGYQHVAGNLMNFLTAMGLIMPPQCYAAWVGESNENTQGDRLRLEKDKKIQVIFEDLVENVMNFTRQLLICPKCGNKFNYEHLSYIKKSNL